jgi:hypothetical protein
MRDRSFVRSAAGALIRIKYVLGLFGRNAAVSG